MTDRKDLVLNEDIACVHHIAHSVATLGDNRWVVDELAVESLAYLPVVVWHVGVIGELLSIYKVLYRV